MQYRINFGQRARRWNLDRGSPYWSYVRATLRRSLSNRELLTLRGRMRGDEQGDAAAAHHELEECLIGLAIRTSQRFPISLYVEKDDLIQEAVCEAWRAALEYDPPEDKLDLGFLPYAITCIANRLRKFSAESDLVRKPYWVKRACELVRRGSLQPGDHCGTGTVDTALAACKPKVMSIAAAYGREAHPDDRHLVDVRDEVEHAVESGDLRGRNKLCFEPRYWGGDLGHGDGFDYRLAETELGQTNAVLRGSLSRGLKRIRAALGLEESLESASR